MNIDNYVSEALREMTKNAKEPEIYSCIECSKEFEEWYTQSRDREIEFCSEECRTSHWVKIKTDNIKEKFNVIRDLSTSPKPLKIPKRYDGAILRDFNDSIKSNILKWIDRPEEMLLLQSEKAGTGKTHLAVATLKQMFLTLEEDEIKAVESGKSFDYDAIGNTMQFIPFTSLMGEIRGTFKSDSSSSERELVKKYSRIRLLVIDDLGTEKASDYSMAVLYEIVNNRYNEMLPTIITTNLTSKEMTGQYGSRLLSRNASGYIIKLDGTDRRVKNRQTITITDRDYQKSTIR